MAHWTTQRALAVTLRREEAVDPAPRLLEVGHATAYEFHTAGTRSVTVTD